MVAGGELLDHFLIKRDDQVQDEGTVWRKDSSKRLHEGAPGVEERARAPHQLGDQRSYLRARLVALKVGEEHRFRDAVTLHVVSREIEESLPAGRQVLGE